METKNIIDQFKNSLSNFFIKEHKKVRENIALCVHSMLRSESVNTAEMARYMHDVNGQSFDTNEMKVYRLLTSKNFQVSDSTWRGYFNLLFGMLKKSGLKKYSTIQINIDFTSDRDDFLILCASVQFQRESIPIYFSLRNYPKRANAFDQKKMEAAFFKALRHLLPDYYRYVIVADRGFGNHRTIELLENLQFDYVIRLTENMMLDFQGKEILASKLPHPGRGGHSI
jgi:hypothetical protein